MLRFFLASKFKTPLFFFPYVFSRHVGSQFSRSEYRRPLFHITSNLIIWETSPNRRWEKWLRKGWKFWRKEWQLTYYVFLLFHRKRNKTLAIAGTWWCSRRNLTLFSQDTICFASGHLSGMTENFNNDESWRSQVT